MSPFMNLDALTVGRSTFGIQQELRLPRRGSRHRHEPHRNSSTLDDAALRPLDDHHVLIGGPHRNHHPSAYRELIYERLRYLLGRRGDDYRVERRFLRPAEVTVPRFDVHVRITQ